MKMMLLYTLLLVSTLSFVSAYKRIYGGVTAQPGQVGHQVRLSIRSASNPSVEFVCGGALLNYQFVLSAAHCLAEISSDSTVTAVMGVVDNTLATPSQTFSVDTYYVHPEYNSTTNDNDISLLHLTSQVSETATIQYVQIGTYIPPIGTNCIVSGWGRTANNGSVLSQNLQVTNITLASQESCTNYFNSYAGPNGGTLPPNSYNPNVDICFQGGTPHDSCQGDSGGSVVWKPDPRDQRWTSIGIVSYGPSECGVKPAYAAYTNVAKYISWIQSIVGNGFLTSAPISGPTTSSGSTLSPSPPGVTVPTAITNETTPVATVKPPSRDNLSNANLLAPAGFVFLIIMICLLL
jgi:secreted trypsin-like serine protease